MEKGMINLKVPAPQVRVAHVPRLHQVGVRGPQVTARTYRVVVPGLHGVPER